MTRLPSEYDETSDSDLDILFGQHVSKKICNGPANLELPECSLHGTIHYAFDEWGRPQPIGAGADDFNDALKAARGMFPERDLRITFGMSINNNRAIADAHVRFDGERGIARVTTHTMRADDPSEWQRLQRRCVIVAVLAFTGAPLKPVKVKPTSVAASL